MRGSRCWRREVMDTGVYEEGVRELERGRGKES